MVGVGEAWGGRRMKERGTKRKRREKKRQRREGNSKKNAVRRRTAKKMVAEPAACGTFFRLLPQSEDVLRLRPEWRCTCVCLCECMPLALGKRSSTV